MANKSKAKFYTATACPYGITYGAWTVRWWNWCYSIPRRRNPTIDNTGRFCAESQKGHTWFLAGVWVRKRRNYPHRKCSVPSNVSILFPLINCEENPLEYPDKNTKTKLRRTLSKDMATVTGLECFVDDQELPPQLVQSDPEFFKIKIRNDMALNNKGGETDRMTTSGYWVFLKPLHRGKHHIIFEGSYQYGRRHAGADYDISVI